MISSETKIAIVGAGAFGLSTALHLAKRGGHSDESMLKTADTDI